MGCNFAHYDLNFKKWHLMLLRPSCQKLSRESSKLSSPLVLLEKGENLRSQRLGLPALQLSLCLLHVHRARGGAVPLATALSPGGSYKLRHQLPGNFTRRGTRTGTLQQGRERKGLSSGS